MIGCSPRRAHGERWGRHWLDLIRFAETSGHEFDFEIRNAWRYRDHIVRTFNDDVPYDRLVREHVAGDLMSRPRWYPLEHTNESILATGFWFLGESKHSPVDVRADGSDRRDNMIDVFGKTFLGLTIACARCHDHKFDPIYTKDYYALAGFLQSSRMQQAFLDEPETIGIPARKIRAMRSDAEALAVKRSAAELDAKLSGLAEALISSSRGKADALQRVARQGRYTPDQSSLPCLANPERSRAQGHRCLPRPKARAGGELAKRFPTGRGGKPAHDCLR